MPSTCTLCDPQIFIRELENAWQPPPTNSQNNSEWTKWFGAMLQRIAQRSSYHCQSLQYMRKPGEWLKIDHVFVKESSWCHFPDVVGEHENGDFVPSVPNSAPDYDEGLAITWAFWKALSVHAHLPVLVAYPWKHQKEDLFEEFGTMAEAWTSFYKREFKCLFLLGWWRAPDSACDPAMIFDVYLLKAKPNSAAEWVQQQWTPNR